MMGRQSADQGALFYEFRREDRVTEGHLLRRFNAIVAPVFAGLHQRLAPYYSATGWPSIDPELMIRLLIIGYCHGICSERRPCEEVALNLAYRWFCRLDLNDAVPDHSSFSKNRHGRFRESDLLRQIFEAVGRACWMPALSKVKACRRRQRDGSQCQPLSWCGAEGGGLVRSQKPTPCGRGSRGARQGRT